jgi:hypothetical protein
MAKTNFGIKEGSNPSIGSNFINQFKLKHQKKMENFYEFCGTFDKKLKADYKKSKIKNKGITFPQFCVVVYSNAVDQIKGTN